MSSFNQTFSSSLGRKLIMSLTGLFLCTFLIVHLIGNLQLFKNDGGMAFNSYAYFMTHFLPIKIVSYLLYLSIIVHSIYALVLTRKNQSARSINYAVNAASENSAWQSRNMGILGTILLIFIVIHMSNFWVKYHWGGLPYIRYVTELNNPENVTVTELPVSAVELVHSDYIDASSGTRVVIDKDLYKVVNFSFKHWWYVLLYVISMAALAFHLIHGFKSAFYTLGLNHHKYTPVIRFIGVWIFGLLIPVLFAAMPVYFYFFK